MNSAEDMLGYYTGKGLAWKWPEPLGRGEMEQSVPKRRHINFRRRGITQKKAYSMLLSIYCS